MNLRLIIVCLFLVYVQGSSLNVLGVFDKIFSKCQKNDSTVKCLKVQVLKIVQRALQSKSFGITEGLSIVRADNEFPNFFNAYLKEDQIEKLESTEIDELLYNTTAGFLKTHRVQLNLPKLFQEESRGKKNRKRYGGPILAALAIKGLFMSMAFKGIAMMSGMAILIGKIALLLSALLGLKKLVNDNHEQTTFEIVKHPVHSHSHSHSSSHSDFDDHYYRNLESGEEMLMQDKVYGNGFIKAYRAHVPRD